MGVDHLNTAAFRAIYEDNGVDVCVETPELRQLLVRKWRKLEDCCHNIYEYNNLKNIFTKFTEQLNKYWKWTSLVAGYFIKEKTRLKGHHLYALITLTGLLTCTFMEESKKTTYNKLFRQ